MRLRLATACVLLCLAAPASAATSRPCVVLTDPSGDATQQPYVGTTPTPNVPAADLVAVSAFRDQARLHVLARLSSAPAPDADSPSGYSYDVRVSINDTEYSLAATTTLDGQDFSLTRVTPPVSPPENVDGAPVTGRFDLAARLVQIDVPLSRLQQETQVATKTMRLAGVHAFTYRAVGTQPTGVTFVLADDTATGGTFAVASGRCS